VIHCKHASFVKLRQNFRAYSGQSTPEHLAAPQALVDAGTLHQAEFNSAK